MKILAIAGILFLSVSVLSGQFNRPPRGGGVSIGEGTGHCLIGNVNRGDGTEDGATHRKVDWNGFVFARLKYHMVPRWRPGTTGIPGLGGWGEVPWHHGFPYGDILFPDSMRRLTSTTATADSHAIVDVDSPDLFKYPFVYMSEPGYLSLTPADAKNLRQYFDRGGFMMVDDFRGRIDDDPANNYEFENMAAQFKKVFPERRLVPLAPDHEIFHIFYDVDTRKMLPSYILRNSGPEQFLGFTDDKGRLDVLVDFNNDIRQYWQGLELGRCSLQDSVAAVELGVNVAVYAMSH